MNASIAIPVGGAWFEGHFPDRPILPGVAVLTLVLDTLAWKTRNPVSLRGIVFTRLRQLVLPGDRLELATRELGNGHTRFDLQREGTLVANGELILGHPDEPHPPLAAVAATPFDAIVLDIMLPGRDGLSVLRQLRERKNSTPVLLLSARGEVNERVDGLNAGADDYLPKPFELAELVARVRALTRRGGENKSTTLRVADLMLDTLSHKAQRGSASIELTAREYRLLEFLMRSAGRLCGRMMILEKVWDYDFDPGTNLVDVYIRRLREKIDAAFEIKLLHTVRGAGYVLRETP